MMMDVCMLEEEFLSEGICNSLLFSEAAERLLGSSSELFINGSIDAVLMHYPLIKR